MLTVPVFVISLKGRQDRRFYVSENFSKLKVSFEFIDAIHPTDLSPDMRNTAIAIWSSHVQALRKFISTGESFGLILEDDIELDSDLAKNFFENINYFGDFMDNPFGIIQCGTMDFSQRIIWRRLVSNLFFYIFGYSMYQRSDRKALILELGKKDFRLIQTNLRAILKSRVTPLCGYVIGSQAYLISRESATWLVSDFEGRQKWDPGSRISLDTFLDENSRKSEYPSQIRTLRISKQILPQRKTPSDNNFY
jgi:GR25 family glycosyltransferase involved in LPS biosynthesis